MIRWVSKAQSSCVDDSLTTGDKFNWDKIENFSTRVGRNYLKLSSVDKLEIRSALQNDS